MSRWHSGDERSRPGDAGQKGLPGVALSGGADLRLRRKRCTFAHIFLPVPASHGLNDNTRNATLVGSSLRPWAHSQMATRPISSLFTHCVIQGGDAGLQPGILRLATPCGARLAGANHLGRGSSGSVVRTQDTAVTLASADTARQYPQYVEFRSDESLVRAIEVPSEADSCLPHARGHRRNDDSRNADSPKSQRLRTFVTAAGAASASTCAAGTLRVAAYPIVKISIGARRARMRPEDRDDAPDFSGTLVLDGVA
jgi:hypothetical protein